MLQLTFTPPCAIMSFMVDQATRTEPVPTPGRASRVHLSPFHDDKEFDDGMDPVWNALLNSGSWD